MGLHFYLNTNTLNPMKHILLTALILHSFTSLSQEYTLTSFQSQYEEIDNYSSMQLETFGDIQAADKLFDLEFSFPYFDDLYDEIQLNRVGVLSFEDELDFSIRLLTYGYDWDAIWDINDIPSDIRYKDTIVDDRHALVVQFTRMRLTTDPTIDASDSYISFQYWLYEDGTIELVIGPYDLSESPAYFPGEGFFRVIGDGPLLPYASEIALYHPTDPTRRYSYEDFDSHEDFTLRNDAMGSIDWMPPEGWMFRFTNLLVSTVEQPEAEELTLYPNPATDQLHMASTSPVQELTIVDGTGREVVQSKGDATIDISTLDSGIYFIHITTDRGTKSDKFIKL